MGTISDRVGNLPQEHSLIPSAREPRAANFTRQHCAAFQILASRPRVHCSPGTFGHVWVLTPGGRGQDAAKPSVMHQPAPTTKNDPAQSIERSKSEPRVRLGGDGSSVPACQGDATADIPARTRASPQTGLASRRQCQNFLVLCDTAGTTP